MSDKEDKRWGTKEQLTLNVLRRARSLLTLLGEKNPVCTLHSTLCVLCIVAHVLWALSAVWDEWTRLIQSREPRLNISWRPGRQAALNLRWKKKRWQKSKIQSKFDLKKRETYVDHGGENPSVGGSQDLKQQEGSQHKIKLNSVNRRDNPKTNWTKAQ